jgi:hypothetical protein
MTDDSARRSATILFAATALVAAITVGSMLVSGWHAGALDNRIEWVFWAGAILGAAGIGTFGVASLSRRAIRPVRVGMGLFLLAPVLCVVAVMVDYWI